MPDRFDILKVDYIDHTEIGLCFAPCCQIEEGDTVETAKGRAFVLKREGLCSVEDRVWELISDVVPVCRVLFKIVPVKYEDD